jgi:hypothetical protein
VENDLRESVTNLAQAHDVSALKWFMTLFTRICSSQEVGQVSNQTALREDKEGAIQNVPGDHSDNRHGFFNILDNVLTVGGSASGEEQAGRPQPQPGGPWKLEGV